jgi:outer membrane protein assembly factor BamA
MGPTFRWLALLAVLCPLPVWAAEPPQTPSEHSGGLPIIVAIEFVGNRVTQNQILRQEMLVRAGDPADPSLIEQSRQAIMNLGLFESVRADVEPMESGALLTITVKEKFYILPVPKLNRDEKDQFTLGAELTVDNLGGYNQQLKLRYETEEANAEAGGEVVTYLFSYNYPRMFGSPWQLQTEITQATGPADRKENWDDQDPTWLYKKQARTAGVQMSRWFEKTGPSQGWQAGGGLIWRRNAFDYLYTYQDVLDTCEPIVSCPIRNTRDSTAVGVRAEISYRRVSDYLYSRQGTEYGYDGEYGSRTLGSDTRYTRHEFYWRYYHLLEGRPHENIDTQLRVGLSSGDMFLGDESAYSLGGNKTLRAYESSFAKGNAYVLLNLQYLRPLFGYYPLRGVIFLDVGNTYRSNNEMHIGHLLWDVGVGLRFRLKAFVKIDLRLDVSYSPVDGETRTFLGTKELF